MILLRALIATIIFGMSICSYAGVSDDNTLSKLHAALIIYPAGKEIQTHTERDGRASLVYWVQQNYPAHEILSYIKDRLASQRWKPLMNDWLNPESPSSHVRGWSTWVDGTVTPNSRVHQWFADWQNEHGDLVFYEFRYDSTFDRSRRLDEPPDNSRLRVTVLFTPKEVAEVMREAARKFGDAAKKPNQRLQPAR
jgi:hypothetical protein